MREQRMCGDVDECKRKSRECLVLYMLTCRLYTTHALQTLLSYTHFSLFYCLFINIY